MWKQGDSEGNCVMTAFGWLELALQVLCIVAQIAVCVRALNEYGEYRDRVNGW